MTYEGHNFRARRDEHGCPRRLWAARAGLQVGGGATVLGFKFRDYDRLIQCVPRFDMPPYPMSKCE